MNDQELLIIRIVYCNKDANNHTIELEQLAKSLQAFAEVFEASGDFVLNNNRLCGKDEGHLVRVLTDARLRPGSVEIFTFISAAAGTINSVCDAGGKVVGIIKYLFGSRTKQEQDDTAKMRITNLLERDKDSLQQSNEDRAIIRKLALKLNDLIADQNDNCRKSTAYIGHNDCTKIRLDKIETKDGKTTEEPISNIDIKTRSCYKVQDQTTVDDIEMDLVITALDRVTGGCKYDLFPDETSSDEKKRHSAKITDGTLELNENAYCWSLSNCQPIKAKVQKVTKNGIETYLIQSAEIPSQH